MQRPNYILLASLAINVVLAIALFKGCNCNCPEVVAYKEWSDTVNRKPQDVKPVVITKKIKPVKILPVAAAPVKSSAGVGSLSGFGECGSGRSTPAPYSTCNDTAIYSDTTEEANAYLAVVADTITDNRIIGRSISFWNLSPVITKHTEKVITAKERIRVYLGLSVGFMASYTDKRLYNFNVGPDVFITEPHGVLLGYGFDARNNGHRLTFAYKIKLKK